MALVACHSHNVSLCPTKTYFCSIVTDFLIKVFL